MVSSMLDGSGGSRCAASPVRQVIAIYPDRCVMPVGFLVQTILGSNLLSVFQFRLSNSHTANNQDVSYSTATFRLSDFPRNSEMRVT
jgi:hypothetical protein